MYRNMHTADCVKVLISKFGSSERLMSLSAPSLHRKSTESHIYIFYCMP